VLISYFRIEVDKLTLLDTIDNLQDEFLDGKDNVTIAAFRLVYFKKPFHEFCILVVGFGLLLKW